MQIGVARLFVSFRVRRSIHTMSSTSDREHRHKVP
jgi:hypothetical protein